ncbi:fluoride efflux transporter CrcB [Nocardia macrotermitis]|uniref:Fluoride-specific ion channel FluC n=1 Tax=Nocardia macrotermitis TaxID=2585198 RepID=A0A7K0DFJ8_9NOCA|nr:fluoride efflux transporter CrcB [Nocardia macrotermitis]MQY24072.1 putative fluoride ion transporter CrcB [Nocardia macrotermitis]
MTEVRPSDGVAVEADTTDPGPGWFREHGIVLLVVALGGGIGAEARYGVARLLPTRPGEFPWGTFATNVAGCFAIGVLMVLITEAWTGHRLVRPFLGVGFLGGFTTFSTYAVETRNLLAPGTVYVAFGYLAGTLIAAMLAVLAAVTLTRKVLLRKQIPSKDFDEEEQV